MPGVSSLPTLKGKISSFGHISEHHVFFHAAPPTPRTSKTASHNHACHPLDATRSRDIRFTWVHPEDPPTTAELRAPTWPPNSPAPNPIKHSWDVTDQIQPPPISPRTLNRITGENPRRSKQQEVTEAVNWSKYTARRVTQKISAI